MKNNYIVCAAIKMKDGLIVTGVRHFSPDMRAVLSRIYGSDYKYEVKEQGFVDNKGNFLNRQEAWDRANKLHQIRYDVAPKGKLFSEGLY